MDNGFYNGLERKNLIFNWHDIEEQGFYHSNGNYESGCTTVPAEDIENKHAIVIGSGIAGLAAACFLVRVVSLSRTTETVFWFPVSGSRYFSKNLTFPLF